MLITKENLEDGCYYLGACRNAIVPQVAYEIIKAIVSINEGGEENGDNHTETIQDKGWL